MESRHTLFEITGSTAVITLNRPEVKNTFDPLTRQEILEHLKVVREAHEIRAVILTGAGDAFSSGGDIRTMEGDEFTAVGGRQRLKQAHIVIRALMHLEKPVIAAINGVVAGAGLSAALACDILLASERARFHISFVRIGVIPDLGQLYLLPLRVGVPKAKELMLTGAAVDAREAERIGLVNRVVSHEQLMDETMALAQRLTSGPSQAQAMIKAALNRWPTDLETMLELESAMQAVAFSSQDFAEGRRAFLEKRAPRFRGR